MTAAVPVMPPRWVVADTADPAAAASLAGALSIPLPLARLLVQRGYTGADAAREFLRPSLDTLADPYRLRDMDRAVEIVTGAVREGRRILVHGDYDVDGQCATALLTRALRAGGAEVVPFVPNRMRDGYDFGPAGLARALEAGASLVITCDCGITAVDTVRAARERGLDAVVTDHHLPGSELPPANAVVDPQRTDDTSGLTQLCGAGLAFKLVQALIPALGLPANLHLHLLDLAALATVADVVPLTGENRVLVRHGLKVLSASRWPGVRALVESARLHDREIRASHLGFVLGPRLNAAGRVGEAMDGVELLLTDDPAVAARLATRLSDLNDQRQVKDQQVLTDAVALVEDGEEALAQCALVLAGDDWHPGVIGIAASRMVERYGRPTFLIAFDGDVGRGSGRSISRFDLHAALDRCGDLLERHGGHHMAAGLTIRRDRLRSFRERFTSVAREQLRLEDCVPEQRVDLVIGLDDVTEELERLCRYLEPCGTGNPAPVFGVRSARLAGQRWIKDAHLKGTLEQGTGNLPAMGFGFRDRVPWLTSQPVDAAFRLEANEWRGEATVEARLVALRPAGSA